MFHSTLPATSGPQEWLKTLAKADIEKILLPVLVQLVVIILIARLFAALFRRLGQPSVVGEIAAGLVLGKSVLGRLFPDVFQMLFHPTVAGLPPELFDLIMHWIFTTLSQLGLIFLLFLIGLEFDFSHLRWHGKAALAISVTGVALPFALGLGLAPVVLHYISDPPAQLGFTLFLGTALSITAIPVLGRIMMELNITRTRLAAITIAAAAVDDALGWILLATVAALVRAHLDVLQTLLMVATTVLFALVMSFVARPLLCYWVRRVTAQGRGDLGVNALAVLLAVILVCAIATNLIGIFAIFGAFYLGAVLSGEHEFRQAVNQRLRDLVTAFFLPIFFTYTGLRTDVGTLESPALWLLCGLIIVAALVGKFGGCALAARFGGFAWREAACIGALMNTRGLMALIVINLGYDLGVVPRSVFCMLVLMALVTTIATTPILLQLMHGTELEPYILRSGFVRRPGTVASPTGKEPLPQREGEAPAGPDG